ncbi:MAG: hypothetical protein LC798_16730 [Chloroflexi bacterium]|nr:hypothetical protein [Chloroflexota bacterium]
MPNESLFPGALDTFPADAPGGRKPLARLENAVRVIQERVGVVGSAVVSSLEKRLVDVTATLVGKQDAAALSSTYPVVVGNGVTDDTASLQAAINTVQAAGGGTIDLPGKHIRFTALTIDPDGAVVTIRGVGGGVRTNTGAFGNAALWAQQREKGTVLVTAATSGNAIYDPKGNLNLEHVVIKGLGDATRTTKGVVAGDGALTPVRRTWVDVSVLNFATGAELVWFENSLIIGLRAIGCRNGLAGKTNTNANVIVGFDAVSCETAIDLSGSCLKNAFYGGIIQGTTNTSIKIRTGSSGNVFHDYYFENASGNGALWAVDVDAGCVRNEFLNAHIGGTGDHVRLAGDRNKVTTTSQFAFTLTNTGTGNIVDRDGRGVSDPWTIDLSVFHTPITQTNFYGITAAAGYFFGGYVITVSPHQNAEIGFDVVLAAGTWRVELIHHTGTDRGIYTVSLDGVTLGTIDGYAAAGVVNTRSAIAGVVVASPGKKRMLVKMSTKNASSTDYKGVLQHIQLVRTA